MQLLISSLFVSLFEPMLSEHVNMTWHLDTEILAPFTLFYPL